MENKFINEDFMSRINHLSEDEKKWAILGFVYLLSGEEGIKKIIKDIEIQK